MLDATNRILTIATKHVASSTITQSQVQIKVNKGRGKWMLHCPRPTSNGQTNAVIASKQALLHGQPAIATGATRELCHAACRYERE